jgi:tRNA(adenine34) deaminase
VNHPQLNHRIEVRGGVLAGRCAELLQTFFRARR